MGVDRVPATPMTRDAGVAKPVLTEAQRRQRLIRRALAARGLVEAVTWSFVAPEQAKLFGGGKAELTLSNPISTELAEMRPSLLLGLVTAAQRNRDRGFADGALFELGQAYRGPKPEDQFMARVDRPARVASAVRASGFVLQSGEDTPLTFRQVSRTSTASKDNGLAGRRNLRGDKLFCF